PLGASAPPAAARRLGGRPSVRRASLAGMQTMTEDQPRPRSFVQPERQRASGKLRIGLIGCGDVAHRRYLPALALFSDRVEIAACCDSRPEAAARAQLQAQRTSPGAKAYSDVAAMLDDVRLDAVINITPAPVHGVVS